MKKKKLNTLNIFGGNINSDVALSRNEMKKIKAGSGCNLYKCCSSPSSCSQCIHCQGGACVCMNPNQTLEPCCWPGSY